MVSSEILRSRTDIAKRFRLQVRMTDKGRSVLSAFASYDEMRVLPFVEFEDCLVMRRALAHIVPSQLVIVVSEVNGMLKYKVGTAHSLMDASNSYMTVGSYLMLSA